MYWTAWQEYPRKREGLSWRSTDWKATRKTPNSQGLNHNSVPCAGWKLGV